MCDPIKYWLYFIKEEYNNDNYIPSMVENNLYAYTDKKQYAKAFEKTHDMKKFITRKTDADREAIHLLAEYYPLQYLRNVSGVTLLNHNESRRFEFVMTEEEFNYITNDCATRETKLYTSAWEDPYMYKKKYIIALEILGYTDIFNSLNPDDNQHPKFLIGKEDVAVIQDYLSCYLEIYRGIVLKGERNEKS